MLLTQLDSLLLDMLLHYSPQARYVKSARDLSHIELTRSGNISSSSKARTYRVGEAYISTKEKTRAGIEGFSPFTLALSVCYLFIMLTFSGEIPVVS